MYKGEFSEEMCVYLPAVGCSETKDLPSTPAGELSAGMIVGAVAALLFLLLAILGFVIWRRYCESAYYYLEDPPKLVPPVGIPDWEEEPGPDGERGAVAVDDFPAHVTRLHADSDIGFSREYDEILRLVLISLLCGVCFLDLFPVKLSMHFRQLFLCFSFLEFQGFPCVTALVSA